MQDKTFGEPACTHSVVADELYQRGASGCRKCREFAFDVIYVEFRDVGIGNVRREGAVPQVDVDEPCLFGVSVEILEVAFFSGIHCFATETDVPSDILDATFLIARKGSVCLDVAAALVKKARV